jgi:XTP/dITP diphosphohydrolase
MKELLIATGNAGKVKEFAELFSSRELILYSLKDFPELQPAVEDAPTFAGNALKKAAAASRQTGLPVIADDSGLCVEALDGRPGVLSARYAGEGAGDEANNLKLLKELVDVPMEKRQAAFRCAIAFCTPEGEEGIFEGELKGLILEKPSGTGGFGYDPLFMVPEYGKTLAELSIETKNRISHRGRAAEALKEYLVKKGFIRSKA